MFFSRLFLFSEIKYFCSFRSLSLSLERCHLLCKLFYCRSLARVSVDVSALLLAKSSSMIGKKFAKDNAVTLRRQRYVMVSRPELRSTEARISTPVAYAR